MTLPVYYTHKTKKGIETILVGMNKYERIDAFKRNNMKKYFYNLIAAKVKCHPLKGKVKTEYKYFYKNSQSDAPNVVAVIDKMFMDALQNINVIKDDNVLNYIGSSWSVGGQDKLNPRIEVTLIEVVEKQEEHPNQGKLI